MRSGCRRTAPAMAEVGACEHAAGRIVRRVEDDEGARRDEIAQLLHVRRVAALRAGSGGSAADELDHGLVNREARVGIDDFVTFIHQREDAEEHDRIAAWRHHHVVRIEGHATTRGCC